MSGDARHVGVPRANTRSRICDGGFDNSEFGRYLSSEDLLRIFRPAVERAVPKSHLPTFRGCRIWVWTPAAFLRIIRDRALTMREREKVKFRAKKSSE